MKTDHLPRHIEEHVKHCAECQKYDKLCLVARKLLEDSRIIQARIDRLPPCK
jgi:hypothetical protein